MMMGNMGSSGGSMGMDMMNMGSGSMAMNGQAAAQMHMGNGYGMGNSMGYGMNQGTGLFGGGSDITSLLGGILNFAIELFVLLLVVGLIVAFAVYIKRALFDGKYPVSGTFAPKTVCTKCGTVLKADWHNCPNCGEAKFTPAAQTQNS